MYIFIFLKFCVELHGNRKSFLRLLSFIVYPVLPLERNNVFQLQHEKQP